MGPLINFLTLMVLLFAGLAQPNSIPRGLGYGVAGALAVVTLILAVVRYNQRKGRGE